MPKRSRRSGLPVNLLAIGSVAAVSIVASGLVVYAPHGRRQNSERVYALAAKQEGTAVATPTPAGTPEPSYRLPDDARPNEMGRIPILMYHSVGDPPLTGRFARFSHLGLSISAATFRKQLEMLYAAGFYPVNLCDTLSPRIDVPRGKSPVVLSFDDARASQFRYHKDGTIDPNCALGVMTAFHHEHPDWPERATFFVLPESKYNPAPFGQRALQKKKVQYLFDHGYEIANHSTSHRPMAHMNATTLSWEMVTCANYFHALVPEVMMQTMALPYGIAPPKALLPVLLTDAQANYENKCIVLASGDASYSPADKRFNRMGVMRIGSEPGLIEHWIQVLKANRTAPSRVTLRPYISDGDPETFSAPESQTKYLNRGSLADLKVVVYADPKVSPKHPKTFKEPQVARKG